MPAVAGSLLVDEDDPRLGVVGEILKKVGLVQVDLISQGGDLADLKAYFREVIKKDVPEYPALGDDGHGSRFEGDVQDFDRGQLVLGVDDAHAVGPKEAHAGIPGDFQQFILPLLSLLSGFRKPRAFQDNRPDPFPGQVDQNFLNVRRRDDDDREVDAFRKIGNGRINFLSLNFPALRVYQEGLFQPTSPFPEERDPESEPG